MLVLELDNIFQGRQNLFVNLLRFQLSHRVASSVLKSTAFGSKRQEEGHVKDCFRVKDGRSHAASMMGKP